MDEAVEMRFESRRLEDGRGGLFIDGELIQTFDTEAESDEAGLTAIRVLASSGAIKIGEGALRDGKPFDLFKDCFLNGGK